jgi:DNA-binding FrmR family transcriptional regulator
MPHSPAERKRVVTRLRRIKGQAEALERAVEAGTECVDLLQQLAALRGATYGLMADVVRADRILTTRAD